MNTFIPCFLDNDYTSIEDIDTTGFFSFLIIIF